jgi:two-component system OmpR family sensor kinase
MNSLFARVWLSYLLVIALTLAATAAIGFGLAIERAETVDKLSPISFAPEARAALSAGGTDGLLRWIVEQRHVHPELQLYFFDRSGRELMSRKVAGRVLPGPAGGLEPLVSARDGPGYKMIVRRTQDIAPTLGDFLLAPEVTVGLVLAISGLGCVLLARFLTRPIEQLRTGVRTIASGDMETRLAPALLRRRDELGSLARDFERMIESLETMIASKEELLRDVSHEIRSPLARLRVAASLARREAGAAGEFEFDRIDREVERIDAMVGEILRFSRLSDGRPALGSEAFDLAELLEETAGDARIEARAAHKELRLNAVCRVVAKGDPAILRSALENVLRNAIRFAPPDSRIEVSLEKVGLMARIEVLDRGPGVPQSDVDRIFDPFFRGENSGGAGLGLAIARRAVLLHGGEIRAQNRTDGGFKMQIVLPILDANPPTGLD